jgi:hypothetical protein
LGVARPTELFVGNWLCSVALTHELNDSCIDRSAGEAIAQIAAFSAKDVLPYRLVAEKVRYLPPAADAGSRRGNEINGRGDTAESVLIDAV